MQIIRDDGNFYEDFELGHTFVHGSPRTITDGDVSQYLALTGSAYALHSADDVARCAGFERRPVDDLLLFHIAFGKTVSDISLNAIANLGYADVRFERPVYTGTTLHVHSRVIGLKPVSSGKAGIVYVKSICTDEQNAAVMTWTRWVMVKRRTAGSLTDLPTVVPDLPATVDLTSLPGRTQLCPSAIIDFVRLTGNERCWEDYCPDMCFHHVGGMTVEDADHMSAARLYQNNSRPHFDALEMAGTPMRRRIAYGGHVMSLCRSLAHKGFENTLGILAMNGGRHANPVFGGDTLYASTEVLECIALPGVDEVGALRLRLNGYKNAPNKQELETAADRGAGPRQAAHVLELDYVVLMPRRTPA